MAGYVFVIKQSKLLIVILRNHKHAAERNTIYVTCRKELFYALRICVRGSILNFQGGLIAPFPHFSNWFLHCLQGLVKGLEKSGNQSDGDTDHSDAIANQVCLLFH